MKKKLIFSFLVIFNMSIVISQTITDVVNNINLEITYSKDGVKSYSSGEKMYHFKNYRFFDMLSEISNVPIQYFILDGNATNKTISLKAYSDNKITKDILLKALIIHFRKSQNIEISLPIRNSTVYVAEIVDFNDLPACKNNIESKKVTYINRTWIGECIESSDLINQINDWYNVYIVNEIKNTSNFNITIQKANSFEELIIELKECFSIKIENQIRDINTIKIDFK